MNNFFKYFDYCILKKKKNYNDYNLKFKHRKKNSVK